MYNNYEFWNFRALRQYIHFLTDINNFKEADDIANNVIFDQNKRYFYLEVIEPYIGAINKMAKRHKILGEVSDKIIDHVFNMNLDGKADI